MDVVSNLPKRPVQVIPAVYIYRRYDSVRTVPEHTLLCMLFVGLSTKKKRSLLGLLKEDKKNAFIRLILIMRIRF